MRLFCISLMAIFVIITGSLSYFAQPPRYSSNQATEKIYEPKEVDRKARITHRSEPRYTDQARRNHTSGWVVLRVVLKSSGEIGDIKVIKDLPDGLTEECIRVTREIKFEPAIKDDNAVSQYLKVQYFFSLE